MLFIENRTLDAASSEQFASWQSVVDDAPDYAEQVLTARALWDGKNNTNAGRDAVRRARSLLEQMCIGSTRCAYCEDSAADEIEHVYPKSFFPELAFCWTNYVFSCGPCNSPKGSKYGVLDELGNVQEIVRPRNGPILPPPAGAHALINPRLENPFDLIELDLGGAGLDGKGLLPTYNFVPYLDADLLLQIRGSYTIRILNLNREVVRKARENAFGSFRARIIEYAEKRDGGSSEEELVSLRSGLMNMPHLTVFYEMRRQSSYTPHLNDLFEMVPEALTWT